MKESEETPMDEVKSHPTSFLKKAEEMSKHKIKGEKMPMKHEMKSKEKKSPKRKKG